MEQPPRSARADDTLLAEAASELVLPTDDLPAVVRGWQAVEPVGDLSYLRWGRANPEVDFLHGGGQNAHTWDLAALAVGRPAIAVELPRHGHSYCRADRNYSP